MEGFKLEGDKCVDLDECSWDITECEDHSYYDVPCDQMCEKHSGSLLNWFKRPLSWNIVPSSDDQIKN